MYKWKPWDNLWVLTFRDGGVSVKRLWLIGYNYAVRNQWRMTINATNLAGLWGDRLAQQNCVSHNSWHENDRQHKASITHLMHILCFSFYCTGAKKLSVSVKKWEIEGQIWNCLTSPFYSNQIHSNAHHIVITTSKLVNRTFPGGLESSISLYQGESFPWTLVYVHKRLFLKSFFSTVWPL